MLLQQIINGLAQGSIYALVGIGFALIFGVLGLVHFAHGEVYMIGAFVGFILISVWHLPIFVALISAMLIAALAGVIIEAIAFRPLRKAPDVAPLVCTLGISVILQNAPCCLWAVIRNQLPN